MSLDVYLMVAKPRSARLAASAFGVLLTRQAFDEAAKQAIAADRATKACEQEVVECRAEVRKLVRP